MPHVIFLLPAILAIVAFGGVLLAWHRDTVRRTWEVPTGDISRSVGNVIRGTVLRRFDGVVIPVPVAMRRTRPGSPWSVHVLDRRGRGYATVTAHGYRVNVSAVSAMRHARIRYTDLPVNLQDDVARARRWQVLPVVRTYGVGTGAVPTATGRVRDYASTAHVHRATDLRRIAAGARDYLPTAWIAAGQVGAPRQVPALAAAYLPGFGDVA